LQNELHTLELSRHANLVESHCSFVSGPELWIIMEYMAGGSALDLMKFKFPHGFEDEHLIATILKGALQGIEYLHKTGRIHRDVKAGNILINSVGEVKLGDFGVAGLLNEGGQRKQNRQTFVGTPCWMAPEGVWVWVGVLCGCRRRWRWRWKLVLRCVELGH
jgi:serine/threonine-protein kinase OSR1/STK39